MHSEHVARGLGIDESGGWLKRKLAIVALSSVTIAGAAIVLWPRRAAPPRSLAEKIRLIENITYEEEAQYFEAREVIRIDGLAWHCEPNNYEKLKGKTAHHGYNVWIAELATEINPRFFTVPVNKFAGKMWTADRAGDSPWGVYSIPEIREKMEPIFEDAKAEIIERLKEKERQRLKETEEEPRASPE